MIPTIPNTKSTTDLRSPVGTMIQKGIALKWFRIVLLVALDILSLTLSWMVAEKLGTPTTPFWDLSVNPFPFTSVLGIMVSIIAACGLYSSGDNRRNYFGLFKAVILGNILFLLVAYSYNPKQVVSRSHFFIFLITGLVTTACAHLAIDRGTKVLRKKGVIRYPVFLIADSGQVEKAVSIISKEDRYNILGIYGASALDRHERAHTLAHLEKLGVTEAFVTWDAIKRRLFLSWHFQSSGITLRVIPIRDEPIFRGASLWVVGGVAALSFSPKILTGIDFRVKRVLDFFCTLILLLVASPLYLLIMGLIKLDSPGSIFYRQTRIGLHGRPFQAWKFRSMVTNADKLQKELETLNKNKDGILFKIDDDPRVTKVGRFLRKHSLDELPQVFNVLMGEMSLVGPRPLPVRDVEQFSEHHFIRHEVLPGITGLWQVSGRSDIDDFEHVLRLDLDYIENWSLWLDFKILFRTVGVVFKKSGAY